MKIAIFTGASPFDGFYGSHQELVNQLTDRGHRVTVLCASPQNIDWFTDNLTCDVCHWPYLSSTCVPASRCALRYVLKNYGFPYKKMLDITRSSESVYRKSATANVICAELLRAIQLFRLIQPDAVMVYNPYRLGNMAVTELADVAGSNRFFYEKGMLPYSFQFDHKGINGESSLANESEITEDIDGNTIAYKLDEIRKEIFSTGATGWQQKGQLQGGEQLRERYNIPEKAKVILYVGQVEQDSNIRLLSPYFKSNYSAMRFLKRCVESEDNVFILGKEHPKSEEKTEKIAQLVKGKGAWVSDAHIHDCLELADCVVSINSSVVLEALLLHKPVVLLGRSVFSNKDIAFEYNGNNAAELAKVLGQTPIPMAGKPADINYWCYRVCCDWLYRTSPSQIISEINRMIDQVEHHTTNSPDFDYRWLNVLEKHLTRCIEFKTGRISVIDILRLAIKKIAK